MVQLSAKHTNLAVRYLAGRASILPPDTAGRLTLLQKTSLINDQHALFSAQMLNHIISDDITKGIGIPVPASQKRLLPPWTRISCGFRSHPSPSMLRLMIGAEEVRGDARATLARTGASALTTKEPSGAPLINIGQVNPTPVTSKS